MMMLKTTFLTMESRVSSDDNDDDVEDHISYHGESSDYEADFSEMDCCSELAEPAVKDPETGDFVLVKLIPINSTKRVHYVGQLTEVSTDEGETSNDVEFYRQSRTMNGRFVISLKHFSRFV